MRMGSVCLSLISLTSLFIFLIILILIPTLECMISSRLVFDLCSTFSVLSHLRIDIRISEKLYGTLLLYKTIKIRLKNYHEELYNAYPRRHHFQAKIPVPCLGHFIMSYWSGRSQRCHIATQVFFHASWFSHKYNKTSWLKCHKPQLQDMEK